MCSTSEQTAPAFAASLGSGCVVTWGVAVFGGDSSAVQDQLKNVQQIQATQCAFAAILADGSVVTWGLAGFGGDSSAAQHELKNALQIQASERAFAAVLEDGSVVTWGGAGYGGDSSAVQAQLKCQIFTLLILVSRMPNCKKTSPYLGSRSTNSEPQLPPDKHDKVPTKPSSKPF